MRDRQRLEDQEMTRSRRPSTRRLLRDVAVPVVALLCFGCSSPAPTPGPLADTQVPNELCGPVPAGEVMTARAADWRYAEGAALTIDRVAINGGESGVHLVATVLVPAPVAADGSASGIGAVTGFPPKLDPGMTERWDLRYPAQGAVYPASATPMALFVVLQRVSPTVETRSVSVDYHRGDERFSMTIPVRFTLVTAEDGC